MAQAFRSTITAVTLMAYFIVFCVGPRPAFAQTSDLMLRYESFASVQELAGGQMAVREKGALTTLEWENNYAAIEAGIDAIEVARIIGQLPANVPMVLARYSPVDGDLVVEIYKVERTAQTTNIYRAKFTPQQGRLWALARTYASPAARQGAVGEGADPFAAFHDPSEPDVFSGIGMDAAQVIIGHAMRHVEAPMAVLAVAGVRTDQHKKKKGGVLKKKITLTVSGYVSTDWYIAAPAQFQPSGSSAAICVAPTGNCDGRPYLIAPALVTFQEWKGGTMPESEELLHYASKSKKGFTVVSFVLASFVFAFAASAVFSAVLGPSLMGGAQAGGAFTATLQSLGAGGLAAGSTTAVALTEAAFYAGLSQVLQGGDLTDIQNGYMGSVGDGRIDEVSEDDNFFSEGFLPKLHDTVVGIDSDPLTPSEYETATVAGKTVQVKRRGGMSAVHNYWVGECSKDITIEECEGQASGVLPRLDSYSETDTTRFYQDAPR